MATVLSGYKCGCVPFRSSEFRRAFHLRNCEAKGSKCSPSFQRPHHSGVGTHGARLTGLMFVSLVE